MSNQVHHNRYGAWARERSGYHFRQLSSDDSPIAKLYMSEAAGSQMRWECIQDQNTLRTQDGDAKRQRTQIPSVDEISHSTAWSAGMAVTPAVSSSTGIQNYGNWTTCWQKTFRSITESSFAGVRVSVVLTPSEELRSTSSEELGTTALEKFSSTSGLSWCVQVTIGIIGCVWSDFVIRQLVPSQVDRHTVSY